MEVMEVDAPAPDETLCWDEYRSGLLPCDPLKGKAWIENPRADLCFSYGLKPQATDLAAYQTIDHSFYVLKAKQEDHSLFSIPEEACEKAGKYDLTDPAAYKELLERQEELKRKRKAAMGESLEVQEKREEARGFSSKDGDPFVDLVTTENGFELRNRDKVYKFTPDVCVLMNFGLPPVIGPSDSLLDSLGMPSPDPEPEPVTLLQKPKPKTPKRAKQERKKKVPVKEEQKKKVPVKEEKTKKGPAKEEKTMKGPVKGEETKKGSAKEEKTKKGPAKGEETKKGPVKEELAKKGPAKAEETKKGPAKEEKTKKGPAKAEETKKGPAKEEKTKKGPAKGEETKKGPAKEEKTKKGPVKEELATKMPVVRLLRLSPEQLLSSCQDPKPLTSPKKPEPVKPAEEKTKNGHSVLVSPPRLPSSCRDPKPLNWLGKFVIPKIQKQAKIAKNEVPPARFSPSRLPSSCRDPKPLNSLGKFVIPKIQKQAKIAKNEVPPARFSPPRRFGTRSPPPRLVVPPQEDSVDHEAPPSPPSPGPLSDREKNLMDSLSSYQDPKPLTSPKKPEPVKPAEEKTKNGHPVLVSPPRLPSSCRDPKPLNSLGKFVIPKIQKRAKNEVPPARFSPPRHLGTRSPSPPPRLVVPPQEDTVDHEAPPSPPSPGPLSDREKNLMDSLLARIRGEEPPPSPPRNQPLPPSHPAPAEEDEDQDVLQLMAEDDIFDDI